MSSGIFQIAAAAGSDLGSARRKVLVDRRAERRTDDDWVLNRASLLSPEDRAVVEGFYDKGMSAVQLARLMDVHPGTVRRRTRELLRHLRSPLVSFVLAHRSQWSEPRQVVAELHILQRRTLRDTARRAHLTMHVVRREVEHIRARFEAMGFEPERGQRSQAS